MLLLVLTMFLFTILVHFSPLTLLFFAVPGDELPSPAAGDDRASIAGGWWDQKPSIATTGCAAGGYNHAGWWLGGPYIPLKGEQSGAIRSGVSSMVISPYSP